MRTLVLPKHIKLRLPEWRPKLRFSFNPEPLLRKFLHGLTLMVYKPTYIGFENIPAEGPGIIVCNHVSYVDGPIIDAGSKRHIHYLIDQDIYNVPGIHYLMVLNKSIPIAYNRKSVEKAFDEISNVLRAGGLVCIFPEGFLTFTGSLGRFRPGIEAICARDPDVPVIPMALSGLWGSVFSRKYMKARFRIWPRKWGRRVTAICGPAIPAEKVNVNYLQDVVLKLKYSMPEK